jgi:phage protein D
MAQAAPIPLYEERETFYVPYFEIKLRGSPLPRNVVRDVIDVTYEDSTDKIDSFTLTVNNWDADKRRPKYVGMEPTPATGSPEAKLAALFDPGNQLELYMGYQGNLRLVMTGFITTVEPDFPESGAPRLTVRGLNVLDTFRRKQYTWSWPEGGETSVRDSDIARSMSRQPDERAHRPGLGIEVRIDEQAASQEEPQQYVLMRDQYPIVFLTERARRRGYSLFVAEEIKNNSPYRYLYFGPSQQLRDITYRLEWGKSLIHFRPTLTTTNQVSEVTVYGWNRRTKQRIEYTAKLENCKAINPDLHAVARAANRKEVITDRPVHTPQQAKKLAEDILCKQLKEMVEASGATVGLPDLRAGRAMVITGVGERFGGRYFVTETTHTFNDSGYRTTFKARREQPDGSRQ